MCVKYGSMEQRARLFEQFKGIVKCLRPAMNSSSNIGTSQPSERIKCAVILFAIYHIPID